MGSKDAPQKMQFLGYNKKAGKSDPQATKRKVAENTHRFDSQGTKIGPNPNFLAYSKSP